MPTSEELNSDPLLKLEDLFDLEELQTIQDRFAEANGVAAIITRPDGTPITRPSNFCRLCTELIRKTEKGLRNCLLSDAALVKEKPSGPLMRPCLSAGLLNGRAGISVGGKHIANWLIGQVRDESRSDAKLLAYAREIGADEAGFRKELAGTRKMSPARFKGICDTLYLFSDQLSRTAHQNYLQRRLLGASAREKEERERALERMQFAITLSSIQDEASLDGILVVDEAGKIVSYNNRFIEIWGIPPEVVASRSDELALKAVLDKLVDPEEFLARVNYHYAHRGEKSREEIALLNNRTLDRYSAPMISPDGRYFGRVWHFREITECKRAEEEQLVLSRQRQLALNAANLGWWHYDPATRVASWDDRYKEIFGVTGSSRPNEEILARLHPEDLPGVWAKVEAALDPLDPQPYSAEYRINMPDGTVKHIEAHGIASFEGEGRERRAKSFVGTVADITGRKRADSALRDAFEMQGVLNAMLQRSMGDGSLQEKLSNHLADLFRLPWLAVLPKGAVFLLGPEGCSLVLTAQLGLSPSLLKTCAAVPLGRCLCGKAAESGLTVEAAELGADHHITYEGIQPHGHCCEPIAAGGRTLGVLNLYLKAGTKLTGEQRRFIKHVTDIMAENILHAQTVKELLQAQKMESVGRLAGGVAHDFNNIITAIKGYAGFLLKGLDPQDQRAEDVGEILAASDRAAGLTRQLLAFSRRQIMTARAADLNDCVSGIANMLGHLIGEDIKLTVMLAPEPCRAVFDTGQIEQVLVNLVVNARDAMPGGGAIELSTQFLPPSAELSLAHPALPRGPLVCLKVKDTGCGMTAEVKSHIYEPFFTTKEPGKGTGLGLSTVFGIVKQSGGDIKVESEPGKGTEFSICFPYSESPHETAVQEKSAPAGAVKGRETILLVEDEESLRRLGRRVLAAEGYTVLTAADGTEALKELERHGKPVDVLLTDVVMPGMNGRELAREIARRELAAKTIYMSGYTDDTIVKHGVLEPGIAFLYKPYTVEALSAKLREVLDGPADQARA